MSPDATLEIKRLFDAAPADVFESWLDREQWQSWIGPEGVDCEVPLFEPKVGGRYRLIMHLPSGDTLFVAGVFRSIEKHRRFSFTWGAEHSDQHTLVTVSLRAVGEQTELTLRHEGLPAEVRDAHGDGWNSALDKLARHLA
jgi:uncharacterized protein YndB with AHSA1/START domain